MLVLGVGVSLLVGDVAQAKITTSQSKAKVHMAQSASGPYKYMQQTFRCDVSNVYGHYSNAVTWHWSWYIYGARIKNAWRETVAVPQISGSWIYNRSFEGATVGALDGTWPWYAKALISHFYFVITVNSTAVQHNAYLTNNVTMYPGLAGHTCSH